MTNRNGNKEDNMKTYEVKFLTKRGGERWWVFYTEADNAKVARCIAEEAL